MGDSLLQVIDLQKYFPIASNPLSKFLGIGVQIVKAVDRISFSVDVGETLGLVGESGCGKSTTGRLILRAIEPTSGQILFDGEDVTTFSSERLHRFRRQAQIVFQDPYSSLNPRMTVKSIIGEPLRVHRLTEKEARSHAVEDLLKLVGLGEEHGERYPHELSGGQKQRVAIARAIAVNPQLIIADEAVSALDVSVRSQILNLFVDLREQLNLTYLFISHDLSVVRYISHRVAVMYLGKIVEIAPTDPLFEEPLHPYTKALLSVIPRIGDGSRSIFDDPTVLLEGELPNPINLPSGCRFHNRCPLREKICREVEPPLREVSPGRFVACHLVPDGAGVVS
ncbi:MAG: ATP-binding cassette domain-containing protein [Candidatus Tectomicrobia bacterium]|nr:ATP-binding cassette domain-containing protein [Candidatus Tectomicrobia bacterium]